MDLIPGIYEQLINEYLQLKLSSAEPNLTSYKEKISNYDPQAVLSRYLYKLFENTLRNAEDKKIPLEKQIEICNNIISQIASDIDDDLINQCKITKDAELLLAILEREKSGLLKKETISRPETSIAHSSLFTGSPFEPGLIHEIKKEIKSSDRVDLLISFIKWSGIRLILEDLEEFVKKGRLRIITTSYTGATDIKAIESLSKLPNTTIKISYDTERTRLHAKSYIFHRNNGFSTAYIGSSNLSNPAVTSGLEWNLKVTEQDSRDILKKIDATFDTYWNDSEFIEYHEESNEKLRIALSKERKKENEIIPIFNIKPFHYQEEILDKLKAERELHENYKNLIVAATGTGKTVISAFDYKSIVLNSKGYPNLLFVAHREEILNQSIQTFRGILKDPNFGDLLVGGNEPSQINHLFTSIQSFNSKKLTEITEKDTYDMIIVDEFHHAAAPSYQDLLSYYEPQILIGLTATPERMDNLDILKYFNNKITAEIRLPEAINRKLLSPFHYFGVTDIVNLDSVEWTRGRYDPTQLSELYTGNKERVENIIQALKRYSTDIGEIIGLGFCVSIEHAKFMAESFNDAGIPSTFLYANSPRSERYSIQKDLVNKKYNFIFVIDLYNEGVDIPEINTILFLRPTESLTIFIQQLGRGLRLADGKECLTVLDFVGRHNTNYQFGKYLNSLLSENKRSLITQIEENSYSLPKGCHIHLEKVAQERVLENIKANITTRRTLIENIKTFEEKTGEKLSFKAFLNYYSLKPIDIYRKNTFYGLCCEAGIFPDNKDNNSIFTSKSGIRLSTIDSPKFIRFIKSFLDKPEKYSLETLSESEKNIISMFYYSLTEDPITQLNRDLKEIFSEIFESEIIKEEIYDLLDYNFDNIEFIPESIDLGFESPIELHCSYTRDQLFAGIGHYTMTEKPSKGSREGVLFLEDKQVDIFLITLNKTEELYSPTTMYMDYAISEKIFHWQSQSTTSETSPTGLRYINHDKNGSKILFFVREFRKVDNNAQPYTFLGTARYISHKGSRPMSIIWELDYEMPPNLFVKANKTVIG